MHPIHAPFSPRMRNRLLTTGMGLGLVQLLQDARRFEEARTTLYALEDGFQGIAEEADKSSQSPCEANHCRESVDGLRILNSVDVQNLEPMTC
jgi:hypothetical protein